MSNQRFDLNVTTRQPGKGTSRGLRNDRKVPAVVYGSIKNASISLEEGAIQKYNVRAYENALFNLKTDDKALNNVVVLMKTVQVHPLTRRPQHVDLIALDLTKTVRVFVEIKTEGKPAGVADGGLLSLVNRQVEIECLPTEIPDNIIADVSALGVGDSLHVSDLVAPKGAKFTSPADMTIAVCNILEEEAAPAADAAAAPAAGAPAAGAPAAAAGKAAPAAAKAPAKK